jgi:hypothetical protein
MAEVFQSPPKSIKAHQSSPGSAKVRWNSIIVRIYEKLSGIYSSIWYLCCKDKRAEEKETEKKDIEPDYIV